MHKQSNQAMHMYNAVLLVWGLFSTLSTNNAQLKMTIIWDIFQYIFLYIPYCPANTPPPPTFATLALVQNAGGAYTRDATISLAIAPSLLVPHNWVKHDLGGGGWAWGIAERKVESVPDASGRLTSWGSRALPWSSWHDNGIRKFVVPFTSDWALMVWECCWSLQG